VVTKNEFKLTPEGYKEAKKYLGDNNLWESVKDLDGFSIVTAANYYKEKNGN